MNHKEALQKIVDLNYPYQESHKIATEALQSESEKTLTEHWGIKKQPTSPSIEKIKVWMPTIWSAPNQVVNKYGNSVQGVESVEGYFLTEEEYAQLKANNHLEELEKWVNQSLYDARHLGMYDKGIEQLEIISNKIQELKTKQ